MQKKTILLALAVVATLTFFTSCQTYGPAYSHQRLTYLERPFGDELGRQVYVSGKVGSDATYKANESNTNGELGVHIGYNGRVLQSAVGVYGVGGQYTDVTKKQLGYYGFGFRSHQNFKITVDDNWEIQVVGLGYTFNSERGKYQDLRFRKGIDSISGIKDLGMMSFTTGARFRTKDNIILGFQYAYGSNNVLLLTPINASHCLSFTGVFHQSTVALNLSIPQRGTTSLQQSGLHPTISLGITQRLTKEGF